MSVAVTHTPVSWPVIRQVMLVIHWIALLACVPLAIVVRTIAFVAGDLYAITLSGFSSGRRL